MDSDSCPNSHCLTWQRRSPFDTPYSAKLCPEIQFVKKGNKMSLMRRCNRGRQCLYAHSKEEELYHPLMYKTKMCSAHPACSRCHCPFAHSPQELRKPFSNPLIKALWGNSSESVSQPAELSCSVDTSPGVVKKEGQLRNDRQFHNTSTTTTVDADRNSRLVGRSNTSIGVALPTVCSPPGFSASLSKTWAKSEGFPPMGHAIPPPPPPPVSNRREVARCNSYPGPPRVLCQRVGASESNHSIPANSASSSNCGEPKPMSLGIAPFPAAVESWTDVNNHQVPEVVDYSSLKSFGVENNQNSYADNINVTPTNDSEMQADVLKSLRENLGLSNRDLSGQQLDLVLELSLVLARCLNTAKTDEERSSCSSNCERPGLCRDESFGSIASKSVDSLTSGDTCQLAVPHPWSSDARAMASSSSMEHRNPSSSSSVMQGLTPSPSMMRSVTPMHRTCSDGDCSPGVSFLPGGQAGGFLNDIVEPPLDSVVMPSECPLYRRSPAGVCDVGVSGERRAFGSPSGGGWLTVPGQGNKLGGESQGKLWWDSRSRLSGSPSDKSTIPGDSCLSTPSCGGMLSPCCWPSWTCSKTSSNCSTMFSHEGSTGMVDSRSETPSELRHGGLRSEKLALFDQSTSRISMLPSSTDSIWTTSTSSTVRSTFEDSDDYECLWNEIYCGRSSDAEC